MKKFKYFVVFDCFNTQGFRGCGNIIFTGTKPIKNTEEILKMTEEIKNKSYFSGEIVITNITKL
jgi:hypothetical protein